MCVLFLESPYTRLTIHSDLPGIELDFICYCNVINNDTPFHSLKSLSLDNSI